MCFFRREILVRVASQRNKRFQKRKHFFFLFISFFTYFFNSTDVFSYVLFKIVSFFRVSCVRCVFFLSCRFFFFGSIQVWFFRYSQNAVDLFRLIIEKNRETRKIFVFFFCEKKKNSYLDQFEYRLLFSFEWLRFQFDKSIILSHQI